MIPIRAFNKFMDWLDEGYAAGKFKTAPDRGQMWEKFRELLAQEEESEHSEVTQESTPEELPEREPETKVTAAQCLSDSA